MEKYAIYLRKSRIDVEAEKAGEGETLARHRKALLSLAEKRGYYVEKIYEEVVSGETIVSRPQMQALMSDVEKGLYYKATSGDFRGQFPDNFELEVFPRLPESK